MRFLVVLILLAACDDPPPPIAVPTPPAPEPIVEPEAPAPSPAKLPVLRVRSFPTSGLRLTFGPADIRAPFEGAMPRHEVTSLLSNGGIPAVVVHQASQLTIWTLDIGALTSPANPEGRRVARAFGVTTAMRRPLPAGGGTSNDVRLIDLDGDGAREIVVYTTSREGDVPVQHRRRTVHRYLDGRYTPDTSVRGSAPSHALPWRGELRRPDAIVARALGVESTRLGPPTSLASVAFEGETQDSPGVGLSLLGGGDFFVGRDIVTTAEVEGAFRIVVLREAREGFEVLAHAAVPGRRGELPSDDVLNAMAPDERRRAIDDPCVRGGPYPLTVREAGPSGLRAVVWRHATEGRLEAVVFVWDGETLGDSVTHPLGRCAAPRTMRIVAMEEGAMRVEVSE